MENNEIKEYVTNLEEVINELEKKSNKTNAIESFLNKKSISNSRKIAENIINEYDRIKPIKTIDDISTKVFDEISKVELAEYFGKIMKWVNHGNKNIIRSATTINDTVNMNPSLHGFLFEQMHVAVFNARAAAQNSCIRAYVLRPKSGEGYAKNSVDIIIKNIKTRKVLKRYQAKCCSEADLTIKSIRNGDYSSQRLLVPEPQAKAVQDAFPQKSVTDHISYDDIKSNPITHSQAKNLQETFQNGDSLKLNDLGIVDVKTYARACAEFMKTPILIDAGIHVATGIATEVVSDGFDIKRFLGNTIGATAEDALILGLSAMTIVELSKQEIKLAQEGISCTVAAVRCTYDIIKTAIMISLDKISAEEGLAQITEEMATTSLQIVGTLAGTKVGAAIGTLINPGVGTIVGKIVGGFLGGLLGGLLGDKLKEQNKEQVIGFFENILIKIGEKLRSIECLKNTHNLNFVKA